MIKQLSAVANSYVEAVNRRDAAAYLALFAEDAVVDDAGREFRGRDAIQAWSRSDIFDAAVTLEVLGESHTGTTTEFTTKVDGNFDRTGLPDPVIIVHRIEVDRDKIVALTCRLGGEQDASL